MDNNPSAQSPENNLNHSTQKEEPVQFPNNPQYIPTPAHPSPKFLSKKIAILIFILILLGIGLSGITYLLGKNQNSNSNISSAPTPTTSANSEGEQVVCTMDVKECPNGSFVSRSGPNCEFTACPSATSSADTSSWKTYISKAEKASFKYPSDWKIVKPSLESNITGADTFGLQSPSEKIIISWVSAADGLGGGCNMNSPLGSSDGCDLFTLIEKAPIKGASGLYLISGTITKDGKIYKPFIAIQDDQGLTKTSRTMGYDMYTGKNNGTLKELNGQNVNVFFTTGDVYGNGPELSKSDAELWFKKPEVIIAKQILNSLTY